MPELPGPVVSPDRAMKGLEEENAALRARIEQLESQLSLFMVEKKINKKIYENCKKYSQEYIGEILVVSSDGLIYHGLDAKLANTILFDQNKENRYTAVLVDPTVREPQRRLKRNTSAPHTDPGR